MANIFNARYVVLFNTGQYVNDQEKFFSSKEEAENFVNNFWKKHPDVNSKICCKVYKWDKENKEPVFASPIQWREGK